MQKLLIALKNRSIRERLLYACVIVTIIPTIILESVFLAEIKNESYRKEISEAEALADHLVSNYSIEMEKAELVADTLAEFTPLKTYLESAFSSSQEAFQYYIENIKPVLAGQSSRKSGVRIRVYYNREQNSFSLELSNSLDELIREQFDADPFSRGMPLWRHTDISPVHPMLSYYRPIQDPGYYSTSYVIAVHLKESIFYSYIDSESANSKLILITDESGTVLTSNDRNWSGKPLDNILRNAADSGDNGSNVKIDGIRYRVVRRQTGIINIYILVSDTDLRNQYLQSSILIVVLGVFLIGLLALALTVITKRITAGMGQLIQKMHNIDMLQIHIMAKDFADENSHDEIAQLDAAFTKMMQQIDTLLDQIRNGELRLKDEIITRQQAELKSLQQQINPHYLFNTLESIRMNLILKQDVQTARIVKIFAESFRRYIDTREKYCSLYEELLFIEKYITIQNYRLDNRIRYRVSASDSALSNSVLKLLVQPIVENCVIHGIEPKQEAGEIQILVEPDDAQIIISVIDTGIGMNEQALSELQKYIRNPDTDKSIGLQNVYRRIKLAYGDMADMQIFSRENKGTTVTITLPKKQPDSEGNH